MIGYILAAVALAGGSLASWYDLRTTEVPDLVPFATGMTGVIIHLIRSLVANNFSFLLSSLAVGTIFLAIGYACYLVGLWGGADALILGAIGYVLPELPSQFSALLSPLWPYQLTLILNIFLVGSVYSILYSIVLAWRKENRLQLVLDQFKERKKSIMLSASLVGGSLVAMSFYFVLMAQIRLVRVLERGLFFFSLFLLLVLTYYFLKGLEENEMKRKIPVAQLKEGDVLAQDVELEGGSLSSRKIQGLDKDEVEAIKQEKEKVMVKSGVCFIPTFPLAVLLTLAVGDLIYLFALSL